MQIYTYMTSLPTKCNSLLNYFNLKEPQLGYIYT